MRRPMNPLIPCLALTLTLAASAVAFTNSKSPVPTVTSSVAAKDLKGDSALVRVRVVIPKGWHIQSNAPLDEFLIPTEIKASGEGVRFGRASFPKPLMKDFPALGGQVALFEDTVHIALTARAARGKLDAKALSAALEKSTLSLRYQACNDSQCLPPKEVAAKWVK
jgi:hypothetical protein